MIDFKAAMIAIVLPGLLTAISLVIAYAFRTSRPRLASLPAFAMAIAFAIAMPVLAPDAKLFSPVGWPWLFWIAVGTAILAALEFPLLPLPLREGAGGEVLSAQPGHSPLEPLPLTPPSRGGGKKLIVLLLGALFTCSAIALLGHGRMAQRHGWTPGQAEQWISISAAATLLAWLSAVGMQRMRDARTPGIALAFCAMAASVMVGLLGKSQVLSMVGIVPGVCGATLGLFTLIFPSFRVSPITWLAIALLSVAVTSAALEPWYAYLPLADGMLVLAAPIAMWAALLARTDRGWAGPVVAVLTAAIFLAVPLEHVIQTVIEYRQQGFM